MSRYATIKARKQKASLFYASAFLPIANAQGLTRADAVVTPDWQVLVIIGIRYVLVIALLIVGLKGAMAGFNWYHAEGSAAKAKEGKETLSSMLIWATALFFLLVIYQVFVPNFAALGV